MIKNKKLTAALMFPILCLLLLTAYKAVKIASGTEVTIPVIGNDPRDLLSGHYLIFRPDFNNDYICSD